MADPGQHKRPVRVAALLGACLLVASLATPILYKYRGPDGEWIYADRPPDDGQVDETRTLGTAATGATVSVHVDTEGDVARFEADNPLYVPVELLLRFTRLEGYEYPEPDRQLIWVLPPRTHVSLLELARLTGGSIPAVRYAFEFRPGDPAAVHRPETPYRVPFAVSRQYPVTQAYPDVVTHQTEDSRYAIDIAMPIGTDIFAARGGVVFDVSANNFRNGLDPERDGPAANVVQVLHDDGTYAVYAHLNWNSIRVRPGDRIVRGQYIADSGNTGFSSGPHLHFVVLRNAGRRSVSVPVVFQGADTATVVPATGGLLTAY